jgi:uncharacterized protein (DUF1499 family)
MIMSAPQLIKGLTMKKRIFLSFLLVLAATSCSGKNIRAGLENGKLLPCPGSPNCVVSQDGDARHSIAPIAYKMEKERAFPLFRDLVKTMDGATLIEEKPGYLRFEFRTKIFKFTDDVEFYFPEEPVIHVRSASRVGYSDMGVNRKRVENIRRLFEEVQKKLVAEKTGENG